MLTLLVLLSCLPVPQSGAPATRSDQLRGTVLDAAGAPVEGAAVRVELAADSGVGRDGPELFLDAGLQQLRSVALPRGRTSNDGSFAFMLNAELAALGAVSGATLALVVEKDDCIPWYAPLGISLARVGHVEVRLSKSSDETIEGRLVVPADHRGPLTGRVVLASASGSPWVRNAMPAQVTELGADGSFRFRRRHADGPTLIHRGMGVPDGFWLEAGVRGFSPARAWFPRDAPRFELKLSPWGKPQPGCLVELASGPTPPAEVQATFRDGRGHLWKVAVPVDRPIEPIGSWSLVSVEAPGWCAAVAWIPDRPKASIVRMRPAPAEDVRFKVESPFGRPLAGAEVEIIEVEHAAVVQQRIVPRVLGGRMPFRQRTDAEGKVTIPKSRYLVPSWVRVRCEGHETSTLCLSELDAEAVHVPKPVSVDRVRFKARLEDGKPGTGAVVLLSDSAQPGSSLLEPGRTDSDGEVAAMLPVGKHHGIVFAPGHVMAPITFHVVTGKETIVEVPLATAAAGELRVVDPEGKPVPWQAFTRSSWQRTEPRLGSSPFSITDRDGRARLEGIPRDGGEVPLMSLSAPSVHRPMLDPEAPVTELVTEATRPAVVLVRIRPGLPGTQLFVMSGNQSSYMSLLDDVGDFRFAMSPGAALISVGSPWLPALSADLTLDEGVTTVVDWRLTDWPEVVLELTLADGSEPPAGVRVVEAERVEAPSQRPHAIPFDLGAPWRRAEDPPKLLRFRVPPAGKFVVELEHPVLVSQPIEIVDGKVPAEPIVLARGSALTLRFPAPEGTNPHRFEQLEARLVRPGNVRPESLTRSISLAAVRDGFLDVPWPNGLLPGEHKLTVVRFALAPASEAGKERTFTVEARKPVTLNCFAPQSDK